MTGAGNAGTTLAQQQAQTNARVNQGMQQINSIFQGGSYGTGQAGSYTPGTQYYNAAGQPIGPQGQNSSFASWYAAQPQVATGTGRPGQGSTMGPEPMPQALQQFMQSAAGNGGLFTGTTTTPGFDQAFYDKIGQNYTNYALPQLNQQFLQNETALNAQNANRGVLGGSSANNLNQQLQIAQGQGAQQIANTALGQEQSMQQSVGQAENNAVNQLIQGQNPSLALSQATQAAAGLQAPNPLPAVGNLFQNFANSYLANSLGSQAAQNPYVNSLYAQPSRAGINLGAGQVGGNVNG